MRTVILRVVLAAFLFLAGLMIYSVAQADAPSCAPVADVQRGIFEDIQKTHGMTFGLNGDPAARYLVEINKVLTTPISASVVLIYVTPDHVEINLISADQKLSCAGGVVTPEQHLDAIRAALGPVSAQSEPNTPEMPQGPPGRAPEAPQASQEAPLPRRPLPPWDFDPKRLYGA